MKMATMSAPGLPFSASHDRRLKDRDVRVLMYLIEEDNLPTVEALAECLDTTPKHAARSLWLLLTYGYISEQAFDFIGKARDVERELREQFAHHRHRLIKNGFLDRPCVACGAVATTIDHIVPIARGGRNDEENLQPMCGPCNSAKGVKTMDEFTAFRGDSDES